VSAIPSASAPEICFTRPVASLTKTDLEVVEFDKVFERSNAGVNMVLAR